MNQQTNDYNQTIDAWNEEYNRGRRALLDSDGHIEFLCESEMVLSEMVLSGK